MTPSKGRHYLSVTLRATVVTHPRPPCVQQTTETVPTAAQVGAIVDSSRHAFTSLHPRIRTKSPQRFVRRLTVLIPQSLRHRLDATITKIAFVSLRALDVPAPCLVAERSRAAGGSKPCATCHNACLGENGTTTEHPLATTSPTTATASRYSHDA